MTNEQTLRETLEAIACLAVGEGDVCELIARRARAALAATAAPEQEPALLQFREHGSDVWLGYVPLSATLKPEQYVYRPLYAAQQPQPAIPACNGDEICASGEHRGACGLAIPAAAPEQATYVDTEAIAWAYTKLLAYSVGNTSQAAAMMLDRLNAMLQEQP